jgi:hypothetical protein
MSISTIGVEKPLSNRSGTVFDRLQASMTAENAMASGYLRLDA